MSDGEPGESRSRRTSRIRSTTVNLTVPFAYSDSRARSCCSASASFLSGQTWRLRTFNPDNLQIITVPFDVPARLILSARIGVRPLENEDFEIAATAWNITELLADLAGRPSGFLEHPQGQPVGGRAFATLSYRF